MWRICAKNPNYEVSDSGQVRDTATKKLLKPRVDKDGYAVVTFNIGGIEKAYIHQLVAEAFLQNPNNLPLVNHKDEDKTNNRVENLEWADVAYNNKYGTKPQRTSQTLKVRNALLQR